MMNPGKIFENEFKSSVPDDVYYVRLHDSASGFHVNDEKKAGNRFSLKSPYDVIMCKDGKMFAIELKSTQAKSLPFKNETSGIKPKQVMNLKKAKDSGKAVSGIVINYRKYEETYFIPIDKFIQFTQETTKKSINIDDTRNIGILLSVTKKKKYYKYDLAPILNLA